MKPWSKMPNGMVLAWQQDRVLSGRPASQPEAVAELNAMESAGLLEATGLRGVARVLGWSPGRVRRFCSKMDGTLSEPWVLRWRNTKPKKSRTPASSNGTETEQMRNRSETVRARPLLTEEDRERDTLSDSGKPQSDRLTPRVVCAALDQVRVEHHATLGGSLPRLGGFSLTSKRQTQLNRCIREVRKHLGKGTTEDEVLQAFRTAGGWMYTSANIRAEGARKTGAPLDTLLRTSCVEYVSLALEEKERGPMAGVPNDLNRKASALLERFRSKEAPHG